MPLTGTSSHEPTPTGAPRPGGPGLLAGRTVSRIGYGAMQLRAEDGRAAAVALLRRVVESGIDHIDTAQFYGDGFVNGVIREAIRPEDGVLVVSKVGATPTRTGRCTCVSRSGRRNCGRASRTTSSASVSTRSRW